jgi:FMN phosphatase YigB (HAD superfamily)
MSQVIYFDIDRTLYDAVQFKADVKQQICSELNIEDAVFDDATIRYMVHLEETNDLNPEEYLTFLAENLQVDKEALFRIYFADQHFKNALYDDVEEVLQDLSKDYTLGIFSQGFTHFQMRKLEVTGIIKYFNPEHIRIERRKCTPETFKKMSRDGAIIDDKPEVIEFVKFNSDFTPIWINRVSTYDLPEVQTIHNLRDLVSILN